MLWVLQTLPRDWSVNSIMQVDDSTAPSREYTVRVELDPRNLEAVERYKILIGAVTPRPIAVVSTCSPAGVPNLAPYSFFNAISSNPMCLVIGPANQLDGTEKDTLRNAAPVDEGGIGEFVVNVAVEPLMRQVAAAAEALPPDESEFDLVGLTPVPSRAVRPPRVAESPVVFECRTRSVTRLAPGEPAGGSILVGEVVAVHIRDELINERFHIDADGLATVGRLGGRAYGRTRERFELPVGRPALDVPPPF